VPWVRFDDQFTIHRKVDGLSDAAFRLHASAIFWSARNLTDGFVSQEDLGGVTARVRTPERIAAECVRREVWHDARLDCPSERCPGPVDDDGWIIHDYWQYQPTKEQVIRDRKDNARRQAEWRVKHNVRSNGVTNASSKSTPARPVSTSPQPPASGGHDGSHPNCRACGTNPRGLPPPAPPTAAALHPSARTPAEAAMDAGITPNGTPLRGDSVAAIAAHARAAIRTRPETPHDP
jgi:hypothetical protein